MIKNKTYRNLVIVANRIMREKHYDEKTAFELAHIVFENLEDNPGHNINHFINMILTKEEYEAQLA